MPFGVDPKTVLCQFYKQGNCDKGRKCKFSHDLAIERKGEKRNLYQDTRDAEKEKEEEERKKDDMANWDEGIHPHISKRTIVNGDFRFWPRMAMLTGDDRKTSPSRPQQTRQPQNHHRQSLQILHRSGRNGEIWLVLELSKRRR